MTEKMRHELLRARVHLTLLEQDATHPLEFLHNDSPTAPPVIVRPGKSLRTAHSDVGVGHEALRLLMIQALQLRIDQLTLQLTDQDPNFTLDEIQYGDHTEA